METVESINLITRNPNVRGGRPCIIGTGLRVTDIVMALRFHKRTPDEIACDYQITMAQVHTALAYYYGHKSEIDTDIREQIETADALWEEGFGRRENPLLPRWKTAGRSAKPRSA